MERSLSFLPFVFACDSSLRRRKLTFDGRLGLGWSALSTRKWATGTENGSYANRHTAPRVNVSYRPRDELAVRSETVAIVKRSPSWRDWH